MKVFVAYTHHGAYPMNDVDIVEVLGVAEIVETAKQLCQKHADDEHNHAPKALAWDLWSAMPNHLYAGAHNYEYFVVGFEVLP